MRAVLLVCVVLLGGITAATAQPRDLIVFAAASLKTALDEIMAGQKVKAAYAASSALARQIEAGAPADVFLSADLEWMDYLAARRLIRGETRGPLLGNRLVLIAPADSTLSLTPAPNFPLSAALGHGRLAMGHVDAVPAGKYGKAALETLGVWPAVSSRIAQADNVRAALLLVARGEAPLGIVYETDAAADKAVRVLGRFPAGSHPPIVYPVAVTANSTNADAAIFVRALTGPAAKAVFEKHGFTVLVQ